MPPYNAQQPLDIIRSPELTPPGTPLSLSPTPSEMSVSIVESEPETPSSATTSSSSGFEGEILSPAGYCIIKIPLEQNLEQLLRKVTGTDDLHPVTKVKLRVIAQQFGLQHIPLYIPVLKELDLDGSALQSLRDLGCSLKHLEVLRVSRCGLTSLDGTFGLETVKELYAGSNKITDCSPCTALPYITTIDLRKNSIRDVTNISFLSICTELKHLMLEDCPAAYPPEYRIVVKNYLPQLKSLDEIDFEDDSDLERELEMIELQDKMNRMQAEVKEALAGGPVNIGKRPATTSSICKKEPVKFARPATARLATANDFICPRNELEQTLTLREDFSAPSVLTSGLPVCGNIAIALMQREKQKARELEERKTNEFF